jgi:hypothetical protein
MGLVEFPSSTRRKPAPAPAPTPAPPGQNARRVGSVLLLSGLIAAALVYWIGTHRRDRDVEELIPNYSAANSRQMGLLYGHSGELMWEGIEALKAPEAQALVILVLSGLAAAVCFRIAWLDGQHAEPDDADL